MGFKTLQSLLMTSRGSFMTFGVGTAKAQPPQILVGMSLAFVKILNSRCNISFQVKPPKILSKKQPPKVSSVDCVTAVLLVLIIDACLEFCCASFFKFQIIHGGFFPPTCAPVGWPPQSLKESHNIWIATYHTQARKKLNLHR